MQTVQYACRYPAAQQKNQAVGFLQLLYLVRLLLSILDRPCTGREFLEYDDIGAREMEGESQTMLRLQTKKSNEKFSLFMIKIVLFAEILKTEIQGSL